MTELKKDLPNKWALNIDKLSDEEREIAKAYWKSVCKVSIWISFKGWLLSDAWIDGSYLNYADIPAGYQEITFEQFSQFKIKKS